MSRTKVAVLIDAENIPASYLPYIVRNIRTITQIRDDVLIALYGDWDKPQLTMWKQYGKEYELDMRHQKSVSQTKSTTDILLSMDAIRLITVNKPDVFCIVADDGDYVPLCEQVRKAGCEVVVMATKGANSELLRVADRIFIMRQIKPALKAQEATQPTPPAPKAQPTPPAPVAPSQTAQKVENLRKILLEAIQECKDEGSGWRSVAKLGSALKKVSPTFSSSQYGKAQLSKMLALYPQLVELRKDGSHHYIRLK